MFEAEVARGIALLDQKVPGWRDKIDLDRLDMRAILYDPAKGCGCILAQLYGNYYDGASELDLGDDDLWCGFVADGAHTLEQANRTYAELTATWRRALTEGASP